ncbi:MAG: VirB3 family type IV secretion system protein [Gemmatimonadota bacterium]|uniref:VirB3 family type IV secretion system protein n=1 Tax=Candidatus Palauibacter soopunensis TaxID=3056739 RepID=UPI0023826299|nr:VirB3 family type IV secretion system protein [Candidatus Palauibacter soopunensis]MDE2782205.1 VirB3 family type IV secretion system protein [Gemmatimonadota bacterium]MDE2879685.1 VirB3 family type IV secretion system protein [Candidatus Palauibacter soopunensis]
MRGPTRWPGYAALNRPLTVLGVERRLFLLGATLSVAVWNATASLMAGGLVFAGCYGAGWLAGRKDPAMLAVLRAAARHPARFDPGKWAAEPWHLKIPGGGR